MSFDPTLDPSPHYEPKYLGRRGVRRRDSILVLTKPGESRPAPKPVPEADKLWRPSEFKL